MQQKCSQIVQITEYSTCSDVRELEPRLRDCKPVLNNPTGSDTKKLFFRKSEFNLCALLNKPTGSDLRELSCIESLFRSLNNAAGSDARELLFSQSLVNCSDH